MVRFGTKNALSQKGTGARRLCFFRLGLTPSFVAARGFAARASYPSDLKENKRLLAVYQRESVIQNGRTAIQHQAFSVNTIKDPYR